MFGSSLCFDWSIFVRATEEMVFAPVADVFSRMTSEMTLLQVQTEDGVRTLRMTPEHPAYVDTMGWVEARMLAPGDEILDYDGNTPLTLDADGSNARRLASSCQPRQSSTNGP